MWPPQHRLLSTAIPAGLRSIHEEARTCFKAKAYRASVVMVRRTIEGVCAENGVEESVLRRSLEALNKAGVIDGRLLEWAQELRVLGNAGAHYTEESITRQDAEDALALAEALLDYVFVLTAKFQEFQQRRAGGKG
nr:DUF4145 domain-containing protein [Micromonospora noduli]